MNPSGLPIDPSPSPRTDARIYTYNSFKRDLGLAIAAHTESKLHALRSPPRPPSGPAFDSYVASLDSLQKALQAELNAQPTQLPKLPNPVGGNESSVVTEGDLLQARIVLASICSKKGEWNEVLNIVPGEAEVGEGFTPGPGKADYMNIMRLKALVLKGRSFVMMMILLTAVHWEANS